VASVGVGVGVGVWVGVGVIVGVDVGVGVQVGVGVSVGVEVGVGVAVNVGVPNSWCWAEVGAPPTIKTTSNPMIKVKAAALSTRHALLPRWWPAVPPSDMLLPES
jgi:hypothetical protein